MKKLNGKVKKKKKIIPKTRRIKILKNKLLAIWGKISKLQQGNCCQICKSDEYLNSHHVIPKSLKNSALKYDLTNAVVLCPSCHKYSYSISAHKNPLIFFAWFKETYPMKYKYLLEHANDEKEYTEEELIQLLEEMQEKYKILLDTSTL